ncbi:MAG TPA: glycosyltransferase family 39 protein, partial [Polyangiales bacterium]
MTVERLQRGVSIGLVAFALAMLAYPAVRLFWDFEIDYNEGWNAVHQARAIAGQPLYGSASPLFFNNYPPLSFYLIGGLGSVLGDSVRTGRLVSLLSLLVVGACCYGVIRASGARRAHGLVALATCLGLFALRAPDYVAMNDPQLLAQAFLCVGLLVYVRHRQSPGIAASVPLWFALGLLTKHNVLLVPLLVSAHVLLSASPRVRLWYSCSAVGLVFAVVITLYCVHGSAFFHALAAPRVYDLRRALPLTVDFLVSVWLPMGPVLLGLIAAHTLSLARWVSAYLALSVLLGAALSGGAGVDVNVFFDAFIAMALGAGLIAQWLSTPERAPRLALAFALVANAGVLAATPSQLARLTPSGLAALDQTERRFQADVAYLQ